MSVRRFTSVLLVSVAAGGSALALATPALAAGERPVAYINADKGMPTENPNVSGDSECETPTQRDTQPLGTEADGKGNVHVDACLFNGSTRVNTQAAFTVSGVGIISACPDPDKEGPQTSKKTGNSCVLSSFEAANSEYHVRVVSGTAGQQTVRFCADPEGNGCGDAAQASTVRVMWGTAPTGGVATGGSSTGGETDLVTAPAAAALAAFVGAGGLLAFAGRRSLARR